MALFSFSTMLDHLQSPHSLLSELLTGQEGLHYGDIRYLLLQHTLKMQHVPYTYFTSLVRENHFQPEGTTMGAASHTTVILLAFLSDDQHKTIEYIHIGLLVCHAGCHQSASFSPLTPQVTDTLSAEQAAEIYQLATECQALSSELVKQFQTPSRLEAMHCAMAHVACSAAYRVATTIQNGEEWESTLRGLRGQQGVEGSQWSAEGTRWDKHEEIWGHATASQKQLTFHPRQAWPWHFRLWIGCQPGISPTMWAFP